VDQPLKDQNAIAETQPKLQPALLGLSAMISQYFIYADCNFAVIGAHLARPLRQQA
jgi:hypothetical protein